MITADDIRNIITDHDSNKPRSKQTKVGPSEVSSPCPRKVAYQILGVPKIVEPTVNLAAWVGTGIHTQMEAALKDHPDWLVEQAVSVTVKAHGHKYTLAGTLDAYHKPTYTIIDWKSVGPSALAKYRRKSPDRYLDQVAIYGLAAILTARFRVDNTAICYIPRNGDLADIHLDVHPWDENRAENVLRRFEYLNVAAVGGREILPHLPTGDDCRFCGWWQPGSDNPETGCPGHNPKDLEQGLPAWETTQESESA